MTPAVASRMVEGIMQTTSAAVRNWLIVVAAMILLMIVLGALTRLTESGLSMVEWRPVTGWLPPMSDAAWHAELQKYLSSPQGRLVDRGFDVDEFKQIFWLEYLHRLWGRVIGVAFALPFAWFWLRGKLSPALRLRLLVILILGGLQGALGWAMVASGLVDRPSVSHYRLAAHLLLAVALYAYTVWLILDLGGSSRRRADSGTRRVADGLIALLVVTMTWGALTAGLRAGTSHNTYPTMSGYWLPPGLFELSPWWLNMFENGTTVQFVHRLLAHLLVLGVLLLALRVRRTETALAGAMALLQLSLGIATILSGVNVGIATAHQAGAVLLLTTLINVHYRATTASDGSRARAVATWA